METPDRRETTEAAAIAVPPDGGAFALLEALVPPKSGPPPHRHLREDETFVVLEGALEFRANGRTVAAPAGTVIHVPKGTVHSYATVGTVPVRMLFLYAPAGMERMFGEIGTKAQPGKPAPPFTPEDMAKVRSVAAKYQFELVEPE